uniref:Uncharacterized protein n=1 Tax=Arundo donax TaxID=35708 RepID=A0A0A9AQT2_ARUDO
MASVRSLLGVEELIELHGEEKNVRVSVQKRIASLREGKQMRNLLSEKAKNKAWTVFGLERLEPVVAIHDAIERTEALLDKLITRTDPATVLSAGSSSSRRRLSAARSCVPRPRSPPRRQPAGADVAPPGPAARRDRWRRWDGPRAHEEGSSHAPCCSGPGEGRARGGLGWGSSPEGPQASEKEEVMRQL